MKKTFSILLWITILFQSSSAQSVSDPLKASFVATDISKFWEAYEKVNTNSQINPFEDLYIKSGSPGVQAFMKGRIESAASLLNTVRERKDDYEKSENK